MKKRNRRFGIGVLIACGWLAGPVVAQEAETAVEEPGQAVAGTIQNRSQLTLRALLDSIEAKQDQLEEKQREIRQEASQERRLELLEEANSLQQQLERLETDFQSVATGIDVNAFNTVKKTEFDLTREFGILFRPIVEELKEATKTPREIEQLRSDLALYRDRTQKATQAIASIEALITGDLDPALKAKLKQEAERWRRRRTELKNQQTVAEFQLETRLSEQDSFLDSTSNVVSNFFATRGLNLLLAIATFLIVFFGLRLSYRVLQRMSSKHRGFDVPFLVRLMDVLFYMFVGIASISAALLVLYATGDWVLLALALLFLFGILWASQKALPMFFEQIRLLLNFGAVREYERLVYNGLPWRVHRLSVYTKLTNPLLTGGLLRLPIRKLLDLHSRPCSASEAWFPCKEQDWVRLKDGTRGQVITQTPEMVQLKLLGGSIKTFQTAEFLEYVPENISVDFRINIRFGIDYRHQAICTTEVPDVMEQELRKRLLGRVGEDGLNQLKVEFKSAGSSSLDYSVLADFRGTVAKDYEALQREIQKTLVDVCNSRRWVIPFTQLTLHQAPK